ncbi:GGDEF domain-containing protein [Pararobbsia silviterrae]|uniref:GGDEF domain-containing protein n=1 Tax=Pararobbsia silviterrae TaxID=1792498 RepID=A0A494XF13_9BURK|nr:GGDEF domain-containing protein [Pararobbsia silviterrae]RKP46193.1 GGDEF domain-containing protein [Pararobbsia silviterrae]
MQSSDRVFTLPRGRLATWLAEPGRDTPHEIRVSLVGTLFGTLPIFFGGVFNTVAVAWVLALRHPTFLFRLWLVAEIAICAIRFGVLVVSRRRAAIGKPTPTDLYLLLAPLWGATVGYGAFVSAISGDWVAATLAFLSAAAMVGGICFRNFAAPRLVAVMIFLSLGPCCLGALVSGERVLLLTLLQIPFYLFAMSVAARRLNAMLIATMKAERENSHRARHDMLTGLLNRAGLFHAAALDGGARITPGMTLLYLDLDGFKPVNDAHGHEAGDTLLMQFANRLRGLGSEQALVARMGGDEFVIIDTFRDSTAELASTVVRAMERPFEIMPGISTRVGVSVGVAPVTREHRSVDALLRAADASMYEAKRGRRRDVTSQS